MEMASTGTFGSTPAARGSSGSRDLKSGAPVFRGSAIGTPGHNMPPEDVSEEKELAPAFAPTAGGGKDVTSKVCESSCF